MSRMFTISNNKKKWLSHNDFKNHIVTTTSFLKIFYMLQLITNCRNIDN